MWVTYTDSHGLGSRAHAEEFFGDLVVDLEKASDVSGGTAQPKYGYSGITIFLASDRSGINARDVEALRIGYSSTGPLQLLLEQEDTPPGEDFRTPLTETSFPQTVLFKLDQATFRQPPWAQKSRSLDAHRLIGIKFELYGNSRAAAHLVLRDVNLEGRNVCILKRS